MSKYIRKKMIFILICLICMSSISNMTYADNLDEKISEIVSNRKESQESLEKAESEVNRIANIMATAHAEAETAQDEFDLLMQDIVIMEQEIDDIKSTVSQAEADIKYSEQIQKDIYESTKQRIRDMYESGYYRKENIIGRIISGNFADYLRRPVYEASLEEYDRKLIKKYCEAKENSKALKEEYTERLAMLENIMEEYDTQKKELERVLLKKRSIAQSYEVLYQNALKRAQFYKNNIIQQNKEINGAIKAEQLATDSKQRIAVAKLMRDKTKEARQKTVDSYKTVRIADTGDVTGEMIVKYALGFVGGTYIWGGTSLTKGLDCSAFTQAVYKHFGYSIPRNSWTQRETGTAVPYSEAKPGDLICYAGHVALYMGNGQIVHAAGRKYGIITGEATYRPILSVRRIL